MTSFLKTAKQLVKKAESTLLPVAPSIVHSKSMTEARAKENA
jgi:hypothetical protein